MRRLQPIAQTRRAACPKRASKSARRPTRISPSHCASDRSISVVGCFSAATSRSRIAWASWAARQAPGFYDMNDVLGLGHTG